MKRKSNLARSKVGILIVLTIAVGIFLTPSTGYSTKAGFLSVKGTWIVDGSGRQILLRGVNYQDELGFDRESDLLYPLHWEIDYAMFAKLGFNVVRLPITWADLEPTPHSFDTSFLTKYVDRDLQWASKYGLYILLEMNQGNWSRKFGGEGAPEWTVRQYLPTESGMRSAISNFWINNTLQEHLAGTWMNIARHYANEPAIVGYDILNEPWAYMNDVSTSHASEVTSFYLKVLNAIRAVDSNHIFFLEPAVFNTYSLPIDARNVVWSPHFYPLSFASTYSHESARTLEADFLAKYQQFVINMQRPMWIGEFGAFMKDNTRLSWLQDAMSLFDKYQIGWAWFAFYSHGPRRLPIPSQVCSINQ